MNFSKKLFTGFTATAVGISLIAGGFSVLANENNQIKDPDAPENANGTGNVTQVNELPAAKGNPTTEYKTEAEITARINELKADSKYKEYAAAQKEVENAVAEARKAVANLKNGIVIKSQDGKNSREVDDKYKNHFNLLMDGILEGNENSKKDLLSYYEKFKNWRPEDEKTYGDLFTKLMKQAETAKNIVDKRDTKAKEAKAILDEIVTLEAKLADLKKEANKSSDNKNSDSKKQETKAKETNKNQKSSNGTNNATATKKADATKIKTGVE